MSRLRRRLKSKLAENAAGRFGSRAARPSERFADDVAGHFGGALIAVGEDDGDLDDAQALAPDLVRQLDLEAVTVGADLVEVGWPGACRGESTCSRRWDR